MSFRGVLMVCAVQLLLTGCGSPQAPSHSPPQTHSPYVEVLKDAQRVGADVDQAQHDRERLFKTNP